MQGIRQADAVQLGDDDSGFGDRFAANLDRELDAVDVQATLGNPEDLEALKPGIATILVKDWDMTDADGEPVPCSAENVLRALGWSGIHVSFEDSRRDQWVSREDFAGYGKGHVVLKAIARGDAKAIEYDGHQRSDEGGILIVGAGRRFAGRPVGDALAEYWLEKAEEHALTAQAQAEEDEKKSEGSPGGEPESSAA